MLKAVFFDLDGTLLPLKEEEFIELYFSLLYKKVKDKGYEDSNKLFNTIWAGTKAMYLNDGKRTNREIFWDEFKKVYGEEKLTDESLFEDFYINEFKVAKIVTKNNPYSREIIGFLKENHVDAYLTTNPIFPRVATLTRMGFVNLKEDDFKYITTYEDFKYCKPNPMYFKTVLDMFNLKSDEVILIGNNDYEDGECALQVGIKTYLIKGEYLIHNEKTTHEFELIELKDIVSVINKEIIKRSGK